MTGGVGETPPIFCRDVVRVPFLSSRLLVVGSAPPQHRRLRDVMYVAHRVMNDVAGPVRSYRSPCRHGQLGSVPVGVVPVTVPDAIAAVSAFEV